MLLDFVGDEGRGTIRFGGLPAFCFVGEVLDEMTGQRESLALIAGDLEHVAEGPFVSVEFLVLGLAERNQCHDTTCALS